MYDLVKWLSSEGITVHVLEIENEGYCFVNDNTICVNSKLDESMQIKVVYHELKHFEHKDYVALYKQFIYQSKMENEAELNVVKECFNEYITYFDGDYEKINYITFLENYELDFNYAPYVIGMLRDLRLSTPERDIGIAGTLLPIHGVVI